MSYNNVPTTNPQNPMWVTGSATTSVTNWPAVQQVTGSVQATGVVFSGSINVAPAVKSSGHTSFFVTASTTSQVVIGSNVNRVGITFSNQWDPVASFAGNAYLSLGTTATTSSFLVVIPPGSVYFPDVLSTEAYSVIFDFPSGSLMITEQT